MKNILISFIGFIILSTSAYADANVPIKRLLCKFYDKKTNTSLETFVWFERSGALYPDGSQYWQSYINFKIGDYSLYAFSEKQLPASEKYSDSITSARISMKITRLSDSKSVIEDDGDCAKLSGALGDVTLDCSIVPGDSFMPPIPAKNISETDMKDAPGKPNGHSKKREAKSDSSTVVK